MTLGNDFCVLQKESEDLRKNCRDDDVKNGVEDKHTVQLDQVQVKHLELASQALCKQSI